MMLPLSIAQKLQVLLVPGTTLPASVLKHTVVEKMLQDGVLQKRLSGTSKAVVFISNPERLKAYLKNHYSIADINDYVVAHQKEDLTRNEAVLVSGNSKLRSVRTFKGFLLNSYEPVAGTINGQHITINPVQGSFVFISDYESFLPDPAVTIVGIENPENFRMIHRQQYLFESIKPLFISRYPQSNDAIKWLQSIPNHYLHFGDLDFSGINIFLHEYKKRLGTKASFFIPPNTEKLLNQFGNRELYNRQLSLAPKSDDLEGQALKDLMNLLHKHKAVLEQEVFIL